MPALHAAGQAALCLQHQLQQHAKLMCFESGSGCLPRRERLEPLQQQPRVLKLVTLQHLVHASISSAVSLSLRAVVPTPAEHVRGAMGCLVRPQCAKVHCRRTSMARRLHQGFKDFPGALGVHLCEALSAIRLTSGGVWQASDEAGGSLARWITGKRPGSEIQATAWRWQILGSTPG